MDKLEVPIVYWSLCTIQRSVLHSGVSYRRSKQLTKETFFGILTCVTMPPLMYSDIPEVSPTLNVYAPSTVTGRGAHPFSSVIPWRGVKV